MNESQKNDATHPSNPPNGQPPPFAELRAIHVARGEAVVLHDLSLTIASGEHVAILGPNGCGKSTLLKVLTCECYPMPDPTQTSGSRSRIFGRERWDVSELRKRLGVVAAELPGPSTAKTAGLDAVLSGFFASSTLWPNFHVTAAMRTAATEALELMEARHLAGKRVAEMSAGEVRRVMIARALVHRPEMLLLDEPSNALDMAAQRGLRESLRRVAQSGTGLVMVTHHLADLLPEIQRVLMMHEGRIIGDGSREQMITPARLQELFGIPIELISHEGYFHSWA